MCLAKAWTAVDRLLIIEKSKLSNKRGFLPGCGCVSTTVWVHHTDAIKTQREKTRWELHNPSCCSEQNLEAALHKIVVIWPHASHLTNSPNNTRHAGHCWRGRDELISDVFLWTPTHGLLAKTYIHQLCADTGCSLEDLPEAMDDRNGWQERKLLVINMCWWWCLMMLKL